ncbi:hypothetical protein B0T24DRAFT_631347 [Lasiosphaeria ovina]|uniref:Secreted protein n=1 Tax=Lasiosphaeria ovina TaxID=92902 RepID=A0AAE0K3T6_9PEZI|nr:hypothetical protein B0T24DRAFT_631347 [Lasiosphaeria ovina]
MLLAPFSLIIFSLACGSCHNSYLYGWCDKSVPWSAPFFASRENSTYSLADGTTTLQVGCRRSSVDLDVANERRSVGVMEVLTVAEPVISHFHQLLEYETGRGAHTRSHISSFINFQSKAPAVDRCLDTCNEPHNVLCLLSGSIYGAFRPSSSHLPTS